ncbi:MAG: hypothetical protein H6Q76_2705 [Firmicutes bacterium]|nr:hypothetical protein [Bacillota bacterium]
MFRKLLLKLTLLNAGVIAILFFVLLTGAYLFSQYDINRRSAFFLSKIASDINAGRRLPGPLGDSLNSQEPEQRPQRPPLRPLYHLVRRRINPGKKSFAPLSYSMLKPTLPELLPPLPHHNHWPVTAWKL